MAFLSLQGCAMRLLDWTTPASGYQVEKGLAYGDHKRHRLDWYKPKSESAQALTVVFFYGGGWEGGDRADYRFVAQALASKGYHVVIPDYRVYPEVLFPKFVDDAAKAVAWVGERSQHDIVLMGHSAGAHIAALLALNSQYLKQYEFEHQRIQGLIGLSGPYDFLPLQSAKLKKIFSGAETIAHTQPINYVTKQAPPTLLVHGLNDKIVYPFNSRHLAKALTQQQVPVTLKLYPETKHAFTVGAMSVPLRKQTNTLNDVLLFLADLPG